MRFLVSTKVFETI